MRVDTSKVLKELFDIDFFSLPQKAQIGLDDVENNHNVSWVRDLYEKNKNNLDNIAIFYRGTNITYREMFSMAEKYAAAFSKKGVKKGSEVPMIMSNCPEFLYSIMGLNLLGAKFNAFGMYDKEYIKEIIDGCDSDFIICTDDEYMGVKDIIDETKIKERLIFSLTDSLPNGIDPYIKLDRDFYDFVNRVPQYKKDDSRVLDKTDLLKSIEKDEIKGITEYNEGDINTEFSVNYSSGTTTPRPKAIVHTNRSFITIGRFQDPDMSGLQKMQNLRGLALIPTHSNSGVISSMSDVLYKGCTVALEPIYKKEFFMTSVAINKPHYLAAARNMIVYGAKQLYGDPRFKGFKMPNMLMMTSVGEPTSKGEEKFINKMMRRARCIFPLAIGGGDCERGGMFFTPYRSIRKLMKNPKMVLSHSPWQLENYPMVQLQVVDKDGHKVTDGQVGILLVKTPTMMKGYKSDPDATKKQYAYDAKGGRWANLAAYAKRYENGTYEMLERVGKELVLADGSKMPLFCIGKEVEKDTKHILSYEVVNVNNIPVVHIEFQPDAKINLLKVLSGVEHRIALACGQEIADKVLFRIRGFEEGFQGTPSEKRSYSALLKEGITDRCKSLKTWGMVPKEVELVRSTVR